MLLREMFIYINIKFIYEVNNIYVYKIYNIYYCFLKVLLINRLMQFLIRTKRNKRKKIQNKKREREK
jgi:hypothetical protein